MAPLWPFLDMLNWTKYLNIFPIAVWTILLLIKGLTAPPNDETIKTMTRTGDRKELLKGPFYFTIVMIFMGTIFLKTEVALTSMGLLGWGDGLAPIFGQKFGKHKYNFVTQKSLEGSLAFFVFGVLGAALFHMLVLGNINILNILICGVLATIVEALSPKDLDNFLIPGTSLLLYLFIL